MILSNSINLKDKKSIFLHSDGTSKDADVKQSIQVKVHWIQWGKKIKSNDFQNILQPGSFI